MKKVVYVIGAGASTEFGSMPVGQELARSIQKLADDDLSGSDNRPVIRKAISMAGGYGAAHEKALGRIRDSILTRDSIDDFVAEWNDQDCLADVARYCIAHEILRGERATALGAISIQNMTIPQGMERLRGTWLDAIVRYSNSHFPRRSLVDALSCSSFVTFNYDRCIEFYLYNYFSHSLGMAPAEAGRALREIHIEHVYGVAGHLPELGGNVPFGQADPSWLYEAASPIKTYCESVESDRLDRIQRKLNGADRIVFLGCAFHEQNLDLLFSGSPPSAEVWATGLGLRGRRRDLVQEFFRVGGIKLNGMKAGEMLAHHHDDLF